MKLRKRKNLRKKKEEEDPRSMPTMVNLVKNKLRAMGMKMDQILANDATYKWSETEHV